MPFLARDVVWDAPPIMVGRKGHLRVAAYLAKVRAACCVLFFVLRACCVLRACFGVLECVG